MTAALEIIELRKSYAQVAALRGVSLRLEAGERLALLGPNGAGKTTLIRCICGLTQPDSGEIKFFDEPLPARGGREGFGVIPQDIALYEDLSARQNLLAFGRFHGLTGSRLKDRVGWALEWTGLEQEANSQVGTFSGGMKRRINLACGVLHSPQVVLLDEPTVGVDPQSRQRIFAMLSRLSDEGTSILLTTHHLDEAADQCDRIVIIDHGGVVANGTLTELIERTVGSSRRVRLQVAESVPTPLPGWHLEPTTGRLATSVNHVARELPGMLQKVHQAGYTIDDVEVQTPSLHHVFLHLTGHNLRD
ncbi:ABC transporter ATP-binding protein [Planctomycetaceae bacterium SH139]